MLVINMEYNAALEAAAHFIPEIPDDGTGKPEIPQELRDALSREKSL